MRIGQAQSVSTGNVYMQNQPLQNAGFSSLLRAAGSEAVARHSGSYTVYLKTEDMLFSGGNGTGLSFYIKYAEDSTEEEPLMVAKGVDESGRDFEQTIRVKGVDPRNATIVEMRALEAYLGADKGFGLSSLSKAAGGMGRSQRADFIRMYDKDISDLTLLGYREKASFYFENKRLHLDFLYRR